MNENEIIQGGGQLFLADSAGVMISLGILHENGLEIEIDSNIGEGVGSADGGMTPNAFFTGGETIVVKAELRQFNKAKLANIFSNLGSAGTSDADGYIGALTGGRNAGFRLPPRRLVVYPSGVNATGVSLKPDSTNTLALEIYKAVNTASLSWIWSPTEPATIKLEFHGLKDRTKTEINQVYNIGPGISVTI